MDRDAAAGATVGLVLFVALALAVLVDVAGVLDADPLAGRGLDAGRGGPPRPAAP